MTYAVKILAVTLALAVAAPTVQAAPDSAIAILMEEIGQGQIGGIAIVTGQDGEMRLGTDARMGGKLLRRNAVPAIVVARP